MAKRRGLEHRAHSLRTILWILAGGLTLLAALWLITKPAMDSGRYLPHGVCYTWNTHLIALHVVSDVLIGIAYFSIPLAILYLTRRRKDLPFSWLFLLFGIFIVACGATHWIEVWTLWHPDYWLAGGVKALTAAASVPTAVALVALMPAALNLPSRTELEAAKRALEEEVAMRREAELQLRQAQADLEEIVKRRTSQLRNANRELADREVALKNADASKNRFLAVLSHELRNPLHAVRLAAQIIILSKAAPDDLRRAAQTIVRQSQQLARLLEDLLDVARITQDKLSLRLEKVNINDAVVAAVEVCGPEIEAKRQKLSVHHEDGPAVDGDVARLTQVFTNILCNASKFTPPEGKIEVHLSYVPEKVVVTVRDDGVGISAAEMQTVFTLFERGGQSDKDGLGVGLALARRLVELHGGTLTAVSAGHGQGTTMTVVIPTAR